MVIGAGKQQEVTYMNIPRNEYPRPQFVRNDWKCLNGEWEFEFDNELVGLEKGYHLKEARFSRKIIVPFCPQSVLSGIGERDFMYGVWYKRSIELSKEQLNDLVFLNFGAVDYQTFVYVNGELAGEHLGGYSSFGFEISKFCTAGENIITLFVKDDERSKAIPTGKQSTRFESYECSYTRTTGVWQTVWLEFVKKSYISGVKHVTNSGNDAVTLFATVVGEGLFSAKVYYQGKEMGCESEYVSNGNAVLKIKLAESHLWEIGNGRLYDVELSFCDDKVKSYFGLRSIALKDGKFLLNGKSVFQRLVLDQGFYPDGIYTAPTDKALENDILLSVRAGFNGARLHQKVFEERFLYYCDVHGYMVWGEYPDWGIDTSDAHIIPMSSEWTEVVNRDFNHPAIIGWCPHNECRDLAFKPSVKHFYDLTKALDSTRPCIDTSGYVHVKTDIFDEHLYDQDPDVLAKRYKEMKVCDNIEDLVDKNRKWEGEPFFVSEFGGIKWADETDLKAWGYGNAPKNIEEFYDRFKGLCDAIMDSPHILGFCYTQLTDVEQEQNGIYRYDRSVKFDMDRISATVRRKAKIEE